MLATSFFARKALEVWLGENFDLYVKPGPDTRYHNIWMISFMTSAKLLRVVFIYIF